MTPKPDYEHRAIARPVASPGDDAPGGATSNWHENPKDAGDAARFYADAMRKYGQSGEVEIQRRVVGKPETVEVRPIKGTGG